MRYAILGRAIESLSLKGSSAIEIHSTLCVLSTETTISAEDNEE